MSCKNCNCKLPHPSKSFVGDLQLDYVWDNDTDSFVIVPMFDGESLGEKFEFMFPELVHEFDENPPYRKIRLVIEDVE